MARIFGAFLLLLLIFAVLYITLTNPSATVDIHLGMFGQFLGVPLVLALFVSFVVGSLVTFLYIATYVFQLQLRIRKLTNRNKEFEQELTAIRSIPIDGGTDTGNDPQPATAGTE